MASENNNNQKAKLVVTAVANETTAHKFCLDLQDGSARGDVIKFINDKGMGWPSCSFSFSDGNLSDVENQFTLNLGYEMQPFTNPMCNIGQLSVTIRYKIKQIPWKINENLESIIVSSISIPLPAGNRSLSGQTQLVAIPISNHYSIRPFKTLRADFNPEPARYGYCFGTSETLHFEWFRNLEVTIYVIKRAEGSVEIVPRGIPAAKDIFRKVNPDFAQYFLSEQLSDWKIKVGEREFPAHRFVLKEISGFFERMFSTEMIENQTREWNIHDFDSAVVEDFLEFAYKGTCKNFTSDSRNAEILKELFRMSHKYDVVHLKDQCEVLLKGMISDQNVVDLYQLGFLYESEILMIATKDQFKRFKQKILPNGDELRKLYENYPVDIIHELIIK